MFLSPLKANLLLDVQVWQLQTQVPSRPTSLEEALSVSIKVLKERLFQSYHVINADTNGMYIYIYSTLPKGKAAFPSAIYNIAYFNLSHYNFLPLSLICCRKL